MTERSGIVKSITLGHSHAAILPPCPCCGGEIVGAFGFGNNDNINKAEHPFISVHTCGAALMHASITDVHEMTREEWRRCNTQTKNTIGLAQIAMGRTNKLRGGPKP